VFDDAHGLEINLRLIGNAAGSPKMLPAVMLEEVRPEPD